MDVTAQLGHEGTGSSSAEVNKKVSETVVEIRSNCQIRAEPEDNTYRDSNSAI